MSFTAASNFEVKVLSTGKAHFEQAMLLVFAGAPGGKATNYSVEGGTMQLHWHTDSKATPLPYAMDFNAAMQFVWNWLQSLGEEAYGEEDDCDGSIAKGWSVDNEIQHKGWSYGICTVRAAYAYYHK